MKTITRKMKEFGNDQYNSSYEAYIENGYLYFTLETRGKDLVYEYRLYDNTVLVETIAYSNKKQVKFKLDKFGMLRIKIFIKEKGKKNNYSFLTEFINFNNITALKYLNPNIETYDEGLLRLSLILKMEKERETAINNIAEKIQAIASMDYNIVKYFKEKGIKQISIYGNKEEVLISKLLWINTRYQKNFSTKMLLSDSPFVQNVDVPRKVGLKFIKLTKDINLDKEDIIVVCTAYKDKKMLEKIEKESGVNAIHITEIISEILLAKFIKEPLVNIKKNNKNINLMVGILPRINSVKNLSENEQNIINNNISLNKAREQMELNDPIIPESLKIFEDSLEYNKELMGLYYFVDKNGVQLTQDLQKDNVNVINNFRLTTDQPEKYDNTIYIFGNSIVFGLGAEDKNTIPSFLQRIINKNGKKYSILNCANHATSDYDYQFDLINSMDFEEGDIIISLLHLNVGDDDNYIYCNMINEFNRPHDLGEIFIDRTHINKVGNEKLATRLYEELDKNKVFDKVVSKTKKTVKKERLADKIIPKKEMPELTKYKELLLEKKAKVKGKNIGSIVMNCNPFTLGHYYLIESSAKKVDHLYIFAVEEDKSYFPFKDRYKLMQEGTKDLKNVTVIPSGKFIISSLTFSDYFNKEKLSTQTINMSDDVTIFAEEIAPTLGITTRFVGEEPLCNVTRQYNATLNRILPKYGINFEIIKRKEAGGEPISASRVRRLLNDKNFDEIAEIVPKTTLDYLIKRFK